MRANAIRTILQLTLVTHGHLLTARLGATKGTYTPIVINNMLVIIVLLCRCNPSMCNYMFPRWSSTRGDKSVAKDLEGDPPYSFANGELGLCRAAEMEGSDGERDGIHLALLIHHPHHILVVLQVEESILGPPNHRGTNSHAVGAATEHPVPNTHIHGESGPEK